MRFTVPVRLAPLYIVQRSERESVDVEDLNKGAARRMCRSAGDNSRYDPLLQR